MYHRSIYKSVVIVQAFFYDHDPFCIQNGREYDIHILAKGKAGFAVLHVIRKELFGEKLHASGTVDRAKFLSKESGKNLSFYSLTVIDAGRHGLDDRDGFLFFFDNIVAADDFFAGSGKVSS